jgi:hypothetical protein
MKGPAAGLYQQGVSVVANAITPTDCTIPYAQQVNGLLTWQGGVVQGAIIGAAAIADPLAGVLAAGGTQALVAATNGCITGDQGAPQYDTQPVVAVTNPVVLPTVPPEGYGGFLTSGDLVLVMSRLNEILELCNWLQGAEIGTDGITMQRYWDDARFWINLDFDSGQQPEQQRVGTQNSSLRRGDYDSELLFAEAVFPDLEWSMRADGWVNAQVWNPTHTDVNATLMYSDDDLCQSLLDVMYLPTSGVPRRRLMVDLASLFVEEPDITLLGGSAP